MDRQTTKRREFKCNTKEVLRHKGKQERKKVSENNKKTNEETSNKNGSNYIPIIITCNVNGLNVPIKRHRVT